MQLIGRVLILALCIFSAYSLPSSIKHINDKISVENVLNKIDDILYQQYDYSTVQACYDNFTTLQDTLNTQIVQQIQQCYLKTHSLPVSSRSANTSVIKVNAHSYRIQYTLLDCENRNATDDLFGCYVSSHDTNLNDLTSIMEQSKVALETYYGNFSQAELAQRTCVSSVITNSKSDSIQALNQLESCTNSAEYELNARQKAAALGKVV